MFEKVNPAHPDKLADRIAGAIVDLAYAKMANPIIAVEVLLGHGDCKTIIETNIKFEAKELTAIIHRIVGKCHVDCLVVPQDEHLAENQETEIRCGDNGIFRGVPLTKEQKVLSEIARKLYSKYSSDGKYLIDKDKLIICQSNAKNNELQKQFPNAIINPLDL